MALLLVGASPGSLTECSVHRHACYEIIMNTEGEGIAEIGGAAFPFTPGGIDDYNTMTVAWGSMGTIWGPPHQGKPILTVYVSPARYTHRFLEENGFFTVSFFPEAYRQDLGVLGSRSGRDGDKVALTRLTPVAVEHGVDFEQAELTFVCKKLYAHQFEKEQVPGEVAEWIYSRVPPHTMFIGEIVDVIER